MPSKSSSRISATPILIATAGLAFLALHCSSDPTDTPGAAGMNGMVTSGTGGTGTAGSGTGLGGTGTAGSGMAGTGMAGTFPMAGTSTGGTFPMAGTSSGGTNSGGTTAGGAGGSSAGAGMGGRGGTGGSGGGSGGSGGGSSGSGGGGGGGTVTFSQVQNLLAMSCKGSKCHDAGNSGKQMDWTTASGLYDRLTMAIPTGIAHCVGDKPVVANDSNSLLLRALKGSTMCSKTGGMEQIGQMPDNCGKQGNPACFTADQIKIVSDWIAGGAKM